MTTKMYVPNIGDVVCLTQPWTFPLHYEHRNAALWMAYTGETRQEYDQRHYNKRTIEANIRAAIHNRAPEYMAVLACKKFVEYKDDPNLNPHHCANFNLSEEQLNRLWTNYRVVEGAYCRWLDQEVERQEQVALAAGLLLTNAVSITLPVGTMLCVDRVYIRNVGGFKGATPSDFNSMTFSGQFNGKKVRFWAKLEDVNNIEFTTP